jgi:peptide chain release factor subunit 1
LAALDAGAVETLIVWENLEINRYVLRNNTTGSKNIFLRVRRINFFFLAEKILHLNKEEEKDQSHFFENGVELECVEKVQLLEWFASNYKKFGAVLEFVTNRSQEGSQFCKGFGGIGGILRYKVDFQAMEEIEDLEDDYDDFF